MCDERLLDPGYLPLPAPPVVDARSLRVAAAACCKKCECRGGLFVDDKFLMDKISDPKVTLVYDICANGEAHFYKPHDLLARSFRHGLQWLVENGKL